MSIQKSYKERYNKVLRGFLFTVAFFIIMWHGLHLILHFVGRRGMKSAMQQNDAVIEFTFNVCS